MEDDQANQWPRSEAERAALGQHIVAEDECGIDALQAADWLAAGVTVKHHAGYAELVGTTIVCAERYNAPDTLYARSLTKLAAECLLRGYPTKTALNIAYSRCASAQALFWREVYAQMSWAHTPSLLFVVALSACRHDIRELVQRSRVNMATALRSNHKVDKALEMLCPDDEPWQVHPTGPVFAALRAAIAEAQVQWREVPPGKRADVDLGGVNRIRVARRDRLLLALILLYHAPGGAMGPLWKPWSRDLPALAPPCFHNCRDTFPELWGQRGPKTTN